MIDDCMLGEKEFGICLGHASATLSTGRLHITLELLEKLLLVKMLIPQAVIYF